jgi:methionyl-tRNA formyltransferase
LEKYFNHDYISIKQDENKATYSKKITKAESEIVTTDSVEFTLRKIRAFNKFPGTFIFYKGNKLKVFKARSQPTKNSIVFKLLNGNIYITQVQSPGKKIMDVEEFLRGQQNGTK